MNVKSFIIVAFITFVVLAACKNPGSPTEDTTPPGEVSNLRLSAGDSEIAIAWTNPSHYDFDHVIITYSNTTNTNDFTGTIDPKSTYIEGLTNGIEYTVTIKTVDKSNNISTGRTVTGTPTEGARADLIPPAEISNLYLKQGFESAAFEWINPGDTDFTQVEIKYGNGDTLQDFVGTIDESGTTVEGLNPNTNYTLLIKTVDDNGNLSEGVKKVFTTLEADKEIAEVYLDVAGSRIYNTTADMQYSTDNGSNWMNCDEGATHTSLEIGDTVKIRKSALPSSTLRNIGTVDATSGYDFIPEGILLLNSNNEYTSTAQAGDTVKIYGGARNIGNQGSSNERITFSFYLSRDKYISTEDTHLFTIIPSLSLEAGEIKENAIGKSDVILPENLESGTWHIGIILGSSDGDLTAGNNNSRPIVVEEIEITEGTDLSNGAIKVVNSWGVGGTWENVQDGHYWLTYETAKSLELLVRYYHNSFESVYEPRILAVFGVDGIPRNEGLIRFVLGDPANPVMIKEFQRDYGNSRQWYLNDQDRSLSGSENFPANYMTLDISEFAPYINDHDLHMEVQNEGTDINGSVTKFNVEFYSDYDTAPIETLEGDTGTIGEGLTTFTSNTTDALTEIQEQEIVPLLRSTGGVVFHEKTPDASEVQRLMDRHGVHREGDAYDLTSRYGYKTGYIPPTEEEWRAMKRLEAIDTGYYRGTGPASVDLSKTKYFPPIGSQGSEGSCSAFNIGYYVHTYMEAREHGWDLSATSWDYSTTSTNSDGQPDSNLDKIFSPDFIYHQINRGEDGPTSLEIAANLLIEMGCATWEQMPYNDTDSESWPSEAAFREAARYRGDSPGGTSDYKYWASNFFTIEADEDIKLLKSILDAGYCVTISVSTDELYPLFDSYDVVSGYSGGPMSTNHAQTVVGYKDGSAWDPTDPDL